MGTATTMRAGCCSRTARIAASIVAGGEVVVDENRSLAGKDEGRPGIAACPLLRRSSSCSRAITASRVDCGTWSHNGLPVKDDEAVDRDGSHGELWLTRRAQLANVKDVERQTKSTGKNSGDGHTSAVGRERASSAGCV